MTVVANAFGTRIDCDNCGEYAASPNLTADQLRRAVGYVQVNGEDLCARCAQELHGPAFAGRFARPPAPERRAHGAARDPWRD